METRATRLTPTSRLASTTRAGVQTAYSWSDRGELLWDGVQLYQWDAAGRLEQVSGPGGLVVEYNYDGANNRTSMLVNGVETRYRVDPLNPVESTSGNVPLSQVLEEATGANVTRYLYGLDLLGDVQAGTTTYYGYDAQNLRLHLNGSGAVTTQYRYGPFGEVIGEGPDGYGFSGERWHDEVGLLYLRARYYRPWIGRFVSRDPFQGNVSIPWTLHSYAYVGNDPINKVDVTGLCPRLHLEPTACEQFAREVDQIIRTTREVMEPENFLGIHRWTNRDIEWATIQLLAEYYGGIKQISLGTGVANPLPRNYTVPVPRWDRYRRDVYPLTEEGDEAYGFKWDFFDNSHHYMGLLYYGYTLGENVTANLLSPYLELWNAFDEKRLPSYQCASYEGTGPLAWLNMLFPKDCRWVVTSGEEHWFGPGGTQADLRIGDIAARHGAAIRREGVSILPSLIRQDLCKQLYYCPE